MGLIRSVKKNARNFVDWFYCKNLPSKRNLGRSNADNWFVLTDHLTDALVYSGGVGKDIYFEQALVDNYNCKVLLFDPSPTGIATINSLKLPVNFNFFDYGLAGRDSKFNFETPLNPQEGSYSLGQSGEGNIQFECRSITSIAAENNHKRIELLKIDIEGFEYDVIEDILNSDLLIRQIVVEFHDFYENIPKQKTTDCIWKLKKHGYTLFHKRGHDYSFVKLSD